MATGFDCANHRAQTLGRYARGREGFRGRC